MKKAKKILTPDSSKGDEINRVAKAAPTEAFDPYDPASLRLDPSYLRDGGVRKLLTSIPVRKPNQQEFIRTHPDPNYRLSGVAIIELREDRETYLVDPHYAQELDPTWFHTCNIYLTINRRQVVFLWPVKLPGPGRRISGWHTSGVECAEKAMNHWIRVVSNTSLGAYEIHLAENVLTEPEWPDKPFPELSKIGLKDRLIQGPEHPVILRLRGAI
jgi:hypothetical protein